MVVPPGQPKQDSETASAGDNTKDITIPNTEVWLLQSIAIRNNTTASRCRVYIGDPDVSGGLVPVLEGVQGSAEEWLTEVFGAEGMPVEPNQTIRLEWKNCVLNDVLEFRYIVRIESR